MAGVQALVADDHPMCRSAEAAALRAALPGCHIDEVATLADALRLAPRADVVLLDLGLPDGHGVAGLLAMVTAAPATPVIVVTGNEAMGLGALIEAAGGKGLVPKSAPLTTLAGAIEAVLGGACWFPGDATADAPGSPSLAGVSARMATLSVAERRVLAALCDGSLNKQIAFRYGLSEITVKQHVKAVLRKLNVLNRTQAATLMQFFDQSNHLPA